MRDGEFRRRVPVAVANALGAAHLYENSHRNTLERAECDTFGRSHRGANQKANTRGNACCAEARRDVAAET